MTPEETVDLKTGIQSLSNAVQGLTVNVAVQTQTIQGFRELYESEIQRIHEDIKYFKSIEDKVDAHALYIAENEGKLKAIGGMIKTGWTVIGVNVVGFFGFLIKEYLMFKGSHNG